MSTRMRRWMTSLLLLGFALPSGLVGDRVIAADPQVVVQNDFEDGTTQGWIPRGPVSLASVTEAAHTGTHSLKTTGRTANWNGPSLDVRTLLQKGATYQISGHVRLVTGQPASTLIFTVQRTPVGGTTAYDRVVASPTNGVTDAGWVQLQGQYTYSTDVSELLLYLESSDPTSQYYLDDFTLTPMLQPPIQTDIPSVYQTISGYFKIGAAIEPNQPGDIHADLLKMHFNSITAENMMKPGPIHPVEDQFNFAPADALRDFARANNIGMRGHT